MAEIVISIKFKSLLGLGIPTLKGCQDNSIRRRAQTTSNKMFQKFLSALTFSPLFCLLKFFLQKKSQGEERKVSIRRLEVKAFRNFCNTISSKFNMKHYFKNFSLIC